MKVDIYYIKSPSGKGYIGQARQYLSNGNKWGANGRWNMRTMELGYSRWSFTRTTP